MKGYDAYQHNKNQTQLPIGKVMPNLILEKVWIYISVNFITKLPLVQGYNSILVVVDKFIKMVHFVPTTKRTSAEGLV